MDVDEALARADAEAYSTADVDVLAAEVRRLRATLHVVHVYASDARDGRNENPAWTLGSTIASRIERGS